MRSIRTAEERVLALHKENHIAGSVHPCVGQEVVPAVVLAHLDERDRVLSTYRGHGWALASGVPLAAFFAEMMGRSGGVNGGRGGSAHMSAPEHGFIGENSIVAGSMPIANGVAMALRDRGEGGIAVCSIGDGATNQGAAHEALVFARARSVPVLFICENNAWSEMTPIADTVPGAQLHDRVRAMGLDAARVDGSDAEGVVAAVREAVAAVREGRPYFLEVSVPRLLGHYNLDIQHYRSESDRAEHEARDPLARLADELVRRGVVSPDELTALESAVADSVDAAVEEALSQPSADITGVREHLYADAEIRSGAAALPTEGRELAYGLAVNRALELELAARPETVTFGEDIAIPGGTFGVTRNLRKRFGDARVFDTPISESAILGAAVGAGIGGMRPIVEIMWSDFLFVAFDQIINQASNVRYVSEGRQSAPLVIRTQQGITPGSCAQHSQSIEALLAHIPGIRVGMPSNAADAFSMTRAAIASDDPVVMIEARSRYLTKGIVDVDAAVEPIGGARSHGTGADVLLVAWGTAVDLALEAQRLLLAEGVDATVLDLRWIAPLDMRTLLSEFGRTGRRAVIVH
ncbi:MAG: thiamine pyrophosphate-dependent enzyme, partial [Microbacterium sp.]